MTAEPDAIVIGSGPAGVTVARPLLEAGMRVLLIDGGRVRDDRLVPDAAYHDLRRNDAAQWIRFLGLRLEALRAGGPPSPKFRAPASGYAFEGFAAATRLDARGLAAVGSLARGGFSGIWGAGLGIYDDDDLAAFPFAAADLAPSYRRVAERMGVSGFGDDDLATAIDREIPVQPPMPAGENVRRLFARYERKRDAVRRTGISIGRPRIAVLTAAHGGREACSLCDACLWGCAHGSIWSAAHDLAALRTDPGLDYRPGHVVDRIERQAGGWCVETIRVGGGRVPLRAPLVVLACGTLATTRLLLEWQGRYDEPVPLLCSPTAAFALCLPERIGAAIATREFSMAQLSFTASVGGARGYGNLFPASGIPASLLIERMPLTRPGAVRLLRLLQPALLVGNCFLPGGNDRHHARLERAEAGRARLVVQAETAEATTRQLIEMRGRIGRAFRRLGAWLLPSSFTIAEPGSDLRYAGTFPMRREPGRGQVDPDGKVAEGLHVVDLSIFPAIGAKHPTFTLMAIADRIGRRIAARAGRSPSRA